MAVLTVLIDLSPGYILNLLTLQGHSKTKKKEYLSFSKGSHSSQLGYKCKQLLHSLANVGVKKQAVLMDEEVLTKLLFICLQILTHWLDFMVV